MAKVRVYELARELNMESKALVGTLVDAGIDVKNYMSTLDEDAVERAKGIVSGKEAEVIEEKRIKPTVIRRRKKRVEVQQDSLPAETEDKEAEEEQLEEAGGDEAESAEAPPEVVEEKKPEPEPRLKPKKLKKKGFGKPAKIIKRPEEGPLNRVVEKKEEPEKGKGQAAQDQRPIAFTEPPQAGEVVKPWEQPERKKHLKKKDKKKRVQRDQEDLKMDVPVRRKKREIFEREDLYEEAPFRSRERKGTRKVKAKAKETGRKQKQPEITVPKAAKRVIKIEEVVGISELAKAMGVKASEIIKKLMALGVVTNINQTIDYETASIIADEFGYEVEKHGFEESRVLADTEDKPEDLKPRPPVITIMGHVDHGKTSLLDYLRKSNIIGGESGGITQHIGAYYVDTGQGEVVFLDTPGHEAFTAMRARGSKVTDLIVLVVAADDGVMPQTKEAINHARAAEIPMVVAVNKMDKTEADPEKVKRELAELDLVPEEWGGNTIFGYISAKTGDGVDDLMGLIVLQAEMMELKANPDKPARGTIIEAKLDKQKGPIATVLVKNGTLHQGDSFVCGYQYGRVRAMLDHRGRKISSAGPSMPVEIYGIAGVPMAGDEFVVVEEERIAKEVVENRKAREKKEEAGKRGAVSLDDLFKKIKEGQVKELNIVLKADVQGSLEALTESLNKLSTEEVKVNIIHSATGAITESDIMLASASAAIIIGFNVRANPRVTEIAEREAVDLRYYDVIYDVTKDIRLAMAGMLEPVYKEHVIGRADIKEIFHVPKVGSVAGCRVTDGYVERNANVRLLRDDVVLFDDKIASLKRFKEDVKNVPSGYECGIGLKKYQDMKPGDVFEVYELEEVETEI